MLIGNDVFFLFYCGSEFIGMDDTTKRKNRYDIDLYSNVKQ